MFLFSGKKKKTEKFEFEIIFIDLGMEDNFLEIVSVSLYCYHREQRKTDAVCCLGFIDSHFLHFEFEFCLGVFERVELSAGS